MQTVDDTAILKVKLLSSIDLDEVAETAAEIITAVVGAKTVAMLMWDSDLEGFGEKFVYGPLKKDFLKFGEAFVKSEINSENSEKVFYEIDEDDLDGIFNKELLSVYCYRVIHDGVLIACILMGQGDEIETEEQAKILMQLQEFHFYTALANAWEYKELKRENDRLRSQYEEMEDKTSMLEEQTVKLIHDFTLKTTMRTKQVERERLIYWISNAVRSSVHIQQVLETTVETLGTNFGVSRCLLLRIVENVEPVEVQGFEFVQTNASPVKDLFYSQKGYEFARQATSKTSPEVIEDIETHEKCAYDREFLAQLNIRSGLIVPLVMRETVLGVLFLQDCLHPRHWNIDDLSFFGALADQLSVAIENAELHQERERQAVTDGLTGVANRRSFNEMLVREFERAKRYGEPLSLVVIDLDHLKKINDTFGHQTGDEAIKQIGATLKQSCRSVDSPARYGGEEFCLLLPNTGVDMAKELAERVRRLINEVDIQGPGKISASLGVSTFPLHADNADSLFQRADEALYVAKQSGRNQVSVAEGPLGQKAVQALQDLKDRKAIQDLQELQELKNLKEKI
jgi:diguanylate cyclase (GGDEF)-like protein